MLLGGCAASIASVSLGKVAKNPECSALRNVVNAGLPKVLCAYATKSRSAGNETVLCAVGSTLMPSLEVVAAAMPHDRFTNHSLSAADLVPCSTTLAPRVTVIDVSVSVTVHPLLHISANESSDVFSAALLNTCARSGVGMCGRVSAIVPNDWI